MLEEEYWSDEEDEDGAEDGREGEGVYLMLEKCLSANSTSSSWSMPAPAITIRSGLYQSLMYARMAGSSIKSIRFSGHKSGLPNVLPS